MKQIMLNNMQPPNIKSAQNMQQGGHKKNKYKYQVKE